LQGKGQGSMFESKTLFVVGAGASAEIDLPVGNTLLETIAKKLNIAFQDGVRLSSGDPEIADVLRHYARRRNESQNDYYQKGRMIGQAAPVAPSIDNFLDAHKQDKALQFCGKLGIVASILEAERRSKLFTEESRGVVDDLGRLNGTWYTAFMKMLVERVDRDEIESVFDNISFVTFNYDRCIQKFLHVALQKYYGISSGRAADLISKLEIIHPYGSVGALPFLASGRSALSYGENLRGVELIEAAARIRTFTEQVEDENSLSAMRESVSRAETLVFLGFAFHPQNMDLLDVGIGSNVQRVFATSYGCSKSDIEVFVGQIRKMLGDEFSIGARFDGYDVDVKVPFGLKCVDLLSEFSRSIPRAID
jgi:hypothetical protein